jgi:hypothetical protein
MFTICSFIEWDLTLTWPKNESLNFMFFTKFYRYYLVFIHNSKRVV